MQSKQPTYIIAEMSANHCGDIELAKQIILGSQLAGANAVKLQTYTPDTMTINSDAPIFQITSGLWSGKTMYQVYAEAATPWEWQAQLKDYADSLGIELFSTPFDSSSVEFLESIGVARYKIASFEAVDYPLLECVAATGKPIIMSTGISTKDEIHEALAIFKRYGCQDVTLLRCVSEYPAPLDHMNLLTIPAMIEEFGVKVGLSDHSLNLEPCIAAVALGACVIEKHVTMDRTCGGPDAAFSLTMDEFRTMVQAVRNTEKILGGIDFEVKGQARSAMRTLFAVSDIAQGEKLTSNNVRALRPGSGLHTRHFASIIGKRARQHILKGTPLSFSMIE